MTIAWRLCRLTRHARDTRMVFLVSQGRDKRAGGVRSQRRSFRPFRDSDFMTHGFPSVKTLGYCHGRLTWNRVFGA